jgi:putative ABC transport system substrate-binding protein
MGDIGRRESSGLSVRRWAWPLTARAQQPMPVIGFSAVYPPATAPTWWRLAGAGGLAVTVNLTLRAAASVRARRGRTRTVLSRTGTPSAWATSSRRRSLSDTRALTKTIPIVFTSGTDPVGAGLVRSLSRPEANVTGVSWFNSDLGPKHLELVRELVPGAALVTAIVNPNNPEEAARYQMPFREAASRLPGLKLEVFNASTASEIDTAFEMLVRHKASAVLVAADPFLSSRAAQLVVLAARNNLPVVYPNRDTAMAGGLISYGNDVPRRLSPRRDLCRPHPQGAQSPRTCRSTARPSSTAW